MGTHGVCRPDFGGSHRCPLFSLWSQSEAARKTDRGPNLRPKAGPAKSLVVRHAQATVGFFGSPPEARVD